MKKTLILVVFGAIVLICLYFAVGQSKANMNTSANAETNVAVETNTAETNANVDINAETKPGVTTSMNGNTSTNAGVPISSTSASKESRSVTGSGT